MTESDVETVRIRALRTSITGCTLHFRENPSLLPSRPDTAFNPQLVEGPLCWVGLRFTALSILVALWAEVVK